MKPELHATAAESRRALERLIVMAEQEILLCLPGLSSGAPLATQRLVERGIATLEDILAFMASRGVRLRVLVPDYDPVISPDQHRRAWLAASAIVSRVYGDAQVICATHAHQANWLARRPRRAALKAAQELLRSEPITRMTPVQRTVLKDMPPPRPACLNGSFAIADGKQAVLGNLDLALPADNTPMPSATLLGSMAGMLRDEFAETWNRALDSGARSLADTATKIDTRTKAQPTKYLRILRTHGRSFSAPNAWLPDPKITEIRSALRAALSGAQHRVIVQTSELEDEDVIRALATAVQRPDVQMTLIFPQARGEVQDLFAPHCDVRTAPRGKILGTVVVVDNDFALLGPSALTSRALLHDSETALMMTHPEDPEILTRLLIG